MTSNAHAEQHLHATVPVVPVVPVVSAGVPGGLSRPVVPGGESGSDDFLDPASVAALAETFRALGDVTRVRILDALSRAERCVQDIARGLDLSESAVSHQLRLLRGMRLVRVRRSGRQMFYALDDHHVVRLFAQGLEHVQERDRPGARTRAAGEAASPAASQSLGSPKP